MANTNTDYTFPEFWAASFDSLDIGNYDMQNMISRDVEPQLADKGDTVNVMLTPDLGNADDWTPGDSITATGVTQEKIKITLDKSKKKTIALTGKELSLSKYDLIEIYGIPMAKTILKAVNLDIYKELMKTSNLVDKTGGSIDEDDIVDAGVLLSNNEVSDMNRMLVAGPTNIGRMKKLDVFQHANTAGDQDVIKFGKLGKKLGFDIYEQHIISKYTPADLTGAINLGAGYLAGVTSMVVDGFNDDANPIRSGDIFKISGETGTPWHVVDTTTQSSGDTIGLSYLVANVDAFADDTALAFTASESVLAFVPNACALAARAYAKLPVPEVNQSIIMVRGLPVRISVWHDGNLGIKVQYDILYGVKLANKNRVARILTV